MRSVGCPLASDVVCSDDPGDDPGAGFVGSTR